MGGSAEPSASSTAPSAGQPGHGAGRAAAPWVRGSSSLDYAARVGSVIPNLIMFLFFT